MKKTSPQNQLILALTFDNPSAEVLRAASVLYEMADLAKAEGLHTPAQACGRDSDTFNPLAMVLEESHKQLRQDFRKLVGCICLVYNREWHEVWVAAYHRFFKATGRHPVSESIRLGLPAHLDYIFTDPSWPGLLHNILDKMLANYHYEA